MRSSNQPQSKENIPRCLKNTFPLKTRGAKELQLPTEVRQCLKKPGRTGFKGTDNKKRASSTKEETPAHADGGHSQAGGQHSGFSHSSTERAMTSQGQRANHEAGLSAKPEATNTCGREEYTHTYAHIHALTHVHVA